MCASHFRLPAARVALATRLLLSPSHQLALSSGLGSARPDRPRAGRTLCVVERFWHGRPLSLPIDSRALPCSRAQPSPCRARHHPPRRALGSDPPLGRSASQRLCRKRLRRSGFAEFWTPPLRGPVCTCDTRFSQRDCSRSARCLPLSIGSAVAVGLCPLPVSRRRPSIPPSFRRLRSPAPRRRPLAASGRPAVGSSAPKRTGID